MNKQSSGVNYKPCRKNMTVANIRVEERADYIEVVFLESARFYKLMRNNPSYDEALGLLQSALAESRILNVGFKSVESDVIEDVHSKD